MSIKLGLHMCGWGARPVPAVLVAARELCYDGVELARAWLEKTYRGLERIGYDSWLIVEQDAGPAFYGTSRTSCQHLKRLLHVTSMEGLTP